MKATHHTLQVLLLVVLGCILVLGCTDATKARFNAIGEPHQIQLYSGGQLVREWTSTGKVYSEESSDGYYFMDTETKKLVRVSGDLVITPIE